MELDDLIGNVKDFFLSQYKSSINNTQSYIAFEPLGVMVAPDDFKINNEFVTAMAADTLSVIADDVPAIDDIFIQNSINKVSAGYGTLLESVQFYSKGISGDIAPYLSLLGEIKSNAQKIYQTTPSTIGGANSEVYSCTSTPGGWYNPDSDIWQQKDFSAGSASSTQTTPPVASKPIVWKLNPITAHLAQNTAIVNNLNTDAVRKKLGVIRDHMPPKHPVYTNTGGPRLMEPGVEPPLVANATETPIIKQDESITPDILSSSSAINKSAYMAIRSASPLNNMVLLNRAIGDNNNTETSAANSTQFEMSFYFSIIYLNRPWMSIQLIEEAKLWYALAQEKDFFSTGAKDASNAGILCAIPKAMIVVKNLSVKAQWSEEDKKAAISAYGLGSFNICNSSFTNNILTAPGIQIIGWMCEVLPELPLYNDENFASPADNKALPATTN